MRALWSCWTVWWTVDDVEEIVGMWTHEIRGQICWYRWARHFWHRGNTEEPEESAQSLHRDNNTSTFVKLNWRWVIFLIGVAQIFSCPSCLFDRLNMTLCIIKENKRKSYKFIVNLINKQHTVADCVKWLVLAYRQHCERRAFDSYIM